MPRSFQLIPILLALLLNACATKQPPVQRTPLSLTVVSDEADFWQKAADDMRSTVPEYAVTVSQNTGDAPIHNQISTHSKSAVACFGPELHLDAAGIPTQLSPLTCHALDTGSPASSLTAALDAYAANTFSLEALHTADKAAFRAQILARSTPVSPTCYAALPILFDLDPTHDITLEENYLIACARAITPQPGEETAYPANLPVLLQAEAALLSIQNQFIAANFRSISADASREGRIYGRSIEAYTEFLSKKTLQAEITALDALRQSDEAGLINLSYHNAMLLGLIATTSETMSGDRLEAIIRATAPHKSLPAAVIDYRHWIQIHLCQLAVITPETTAQLAASCMPMLKLSTDDPDGFENALMLVEHGFYNTTEGPRIAREVLDWLQSVPADAQIRQIRHEFGQRLCTHPDLDAETRDILRSF
ncbi:MAG: hypothetical protein IKY83_02205 [Proteobacteria bacterium]|nr:hypothetical protein [Pseudomonadota bacterium]